MPLKTLTIYPLNLFNILSDVSIYGVMAVGMTLVILTAGIDLLVGAILAFAAMSAAAILKGTGESRAIPEDPLAFGGFAWLIALLVATGVGSICGWVQGFATTRLKVPPFAVTLVGMTVWRGATLVVGEGSPISGFAPGLRWWANEVLAAKIPIVTVDRSVAGTTEPIAHVGADNVAAGVAMAEYVIKKFPNGARSIFLRGEPGSSPAIDRAKGTLETLKAAGDKYKVLADQTANFKRNQGMTVTQNLLTSIGTPPDVIICSNDDMALGAEEALQQAGIQSRTNRRSEVGAVGRQSSAAFQAGTAPGSDKGSNRRPRRFLKERISLSLVLLRVLLFGSFVVSRSLHYLALATHNPSISSCQTPSYAASIVGSVHSAAWTG